MYEYFTENPSFRNNITVQSDKPMQAAKYLEIPKGIHASIVEMLQRSHIDRLYSHQAEAMEYILSGKNTVITTGVASGKSLCYQLPVLNDLLLSRDFTTLMMFPMKALAQDQFNKLGALLKDTGIKEEVGIYDGDTPTEKRNRIRESNRIILTNPDMLNLGILPNHTKWSKFFARLKYVIIDEVHIYRGVFGSHLANLLRRLKRISTHYGGDIQFILTSATLSGIRPFVSNLIESEFEVVEEDGSPHGERHFIIYNPPVINEELGIRRNLIQETVRIGSFLHDFPGQTLIFTVTRRSVELLISYLQSSEVGLKDSILGYRAGYLPQERREIENKLRAEEIKMVVATNALELGIDIGGLDNVVISGYPGSIASVFQQSGRAGRQATESMTIFVAGSGLLDQYLVQHPEFLLDRSPEEPLINPDNPYILLFHLQCALFEKPFLTGEKFGNLNPEDLTRYLQLLQKMGKAYQSKERYYWKSAEFPAEQFSMRSTGNRNFRLQSNGTTIGIVDEPSAYWMVHPEAIYIHNGETYYVNELDFEKKEAVLDAIKCDYFTQVMSKTEYELLEKYSEKDADTLNAYIGQIQVTDTVTGYKKMKWHTNEILGYFDLEMPPVQLITDGFWLGFKDETINSLKEKGAWNNRQNDYGPGWTNLKKIIRERDKHTCQACQVEEKDKAFDVHHIKPFRTFPNRLQANAPENLITLCPACHREAEKKLIIQSGLAGLSYLFGNIAPIYLMCDSKDIRVNYKANNNLSEEECAVIFHDSAAGGIGLSKKLYEIFPTLLKEGQRHVQACPCKDGCPACVGPVAEQGEGAKEIVLEMLKELNRGN
ncbi:MAG: DEAD/DEAH box helicase [Candidatus Cloacimonetes bacterium]|nr:DEAD/DEAH box helicase [Candidatus Cloacimonadota bacterium]